jgi:hypothetical protein
MPRGNFFSPAEKSLYPVTPRAAATAHRLRSVIESMYEIGNYGKYFGDLKKNSPKYMNVKKM